MSPGLFPRGLPRVRQVCCGLLGLLTLHLALTARSHDFLAGFLQHLIVLELGAKHLDVTVHLTFFEDGSEHEREHMDANGDGRLSRAETEAYLAELEPKLNRAVTLRLAGLPAATVAPAGQPVPLTPLRAPELDLLGNERVGRGHHRLTLHFFAPTPTNLAPGAELVVEDRLWPKSRALGVLRVEGKDGCRLESLPRTDPTFPPAREGEARAFKARLLAPPAAPPPQPAPAHAHIKKTAQPQRPP